LADPALYIFVQLAARMLTYVECDAAAAEEGLVPMYPKTRSNVDYTLKKLWKEKWRPVINAIRL
jgi:hypothetical protein